MTDKTIKNIGTQIAELRKQKGLTQDELASRLCITSQAISKWERGKGLPDITIFPSIAEALGVSVGALFGESEYAKPYVAENFDGLPLVSREGNTACYSNKKVLSADDNEVLFADGSRAEFSSRTVINRGVGEVRFVEIDTMTPHVDNGETSLEKSFSEYEIDSLYLSCSLPCTARILLSDGSFEGIRATGSSIFISLIDATVSGGTFEIKAKSLNNGASHEDTEQNKLDVYIPRTCNKTAKLKISGCANITSTTDFDVTTLSIAGSGMISAKSAKNVSASIAGSGVIEFVNAYESSELSIAGSGVIKADGLGKKSTVKISGSGDVSASSAENMTVNIAGSGDVSVKNTKGDLSFTVAGSGDMSCGGNVGKLMIKISGSGDMKGKNLTADEADINIVGSGEVELERIITCSTEKLSKDAKLIVHQRG